MTGIVKDFFDKFMDDTVEVALDDFPSKVGQEIRDLQQHIAALEVRVCEQQQQLKRLEEHKFQPINETRTVSLGEVNAAVVLQSELGNSQNMSEMSARISGLENRAQEISDLVNLHTTLIQSHGKTVEEVQSIVRYLEQIKLSMSKNPQSSPAITTTTTNSGVFELPSNIGPFTLHEQVDFMAVGKKTEGEKLKTKEEIFAELSNISILFDNQLMKMKTLQTKAMALGSQKDVMNMLYNSVVSELLFSRSLTDLERKKCDELEEDTRMALYLLGPAVCRHNDDKRISRGELSSIWSKVNLQHEELRVSYEFIDLILTGLAKIQELHRECGELVKEIKEAKRSPPYVISHMSGYYPNRSPQVLIKFQECVRSYERRSREIYQESLDCQSKLPELYLEFFEIQEDNYAEQLAPLAQDRVQREFNVNRYRATIEKANVERKAMYETMKKLWNELICYHEDMGIQMVQIRDMAFENKGLAYKFWTSANEDYKQLTFQFPDKY